METEGREVQGYAQIGTHLKGRLQALTLLLMLWYAYRQDPGMVALPEAKQAAESIKSRYLHTTSDRAGDLFG